jgi:hypothetical protein
LKRVNARIAQVAAEMKRERALTAMQAALSRRRAANESASKNGYGGGHDHPAMSFRPNRKPRPIIHGARIGSVSQAGRVAQAIRDARQ